MNKAFKQVLQASQLSEKPSLGKARSFLIEFKQKMRLTIPCIVSNVSNMGSHHCEGNISETMSVNFEKIVEDEKEWIDPYDSVWLKLGTIIVYIIEGRHSSINNPKEKEEVKKVNI